MRKYIFSFFAILVSLTISAKGEIDPKYAEGAVPVDENGSVRFSCTIDIPEQFSQDDCFRMMLSWAKGRFAPPYAHAGRIISENNDTHRFVIHANQTLTFKHTGMEIDEAEIEFNFSVAVGEKSVTATITDIKYRYEEEREGGGQAFTAEEWITDDEAFNAKHTKFYKRAGKFRIKTIDMKDRLFESMSETLSEDK